MLQENTNNGVIAEVKATDYLAGSVYHEERFTSYDKYLPDFERQNDRGFDRQACVTYSILKSIQTQMNYLLDKGEFSFMQKLHMRMLGHIKNSKFNYSERVIAKMSGTTRQGNSATRVADTVRNIGLIAESRYPDEGQTWEEYYKEVTSEILEYCKRIFKFVKIQSSWVTTNGLALKTEDKKELFQHHLKHAPLVLLAPVCPGWNNPKVKTCGLTETQHATMIYSVDDTIKILDSYAPFLKELDLEYPTPCVMKVVVYPVKDSNKYKYWS